jgi:hypothetical protein
MTPAEQMGFGFEAVAEEKETSHLPSDMEAGIAAYRGMLEQHHRAMIDGDVKAAMEIRKEVHRMAGKVNGGVGILGGPWLCLGLSTDERYSSSAGNRTDVGPEGRV